MADDGGEIGVVERGALQPAIVEQKTERLDQIDADPETSGEPQQRTGVLRDVRLIESEAQRNLLRPANAHRPSDYGGGHFAAFPADLCVGLSHSSASSTV